MKKSRLLAIGLIVSIIINILCILPYWGDYYERFKEKVFPTTYFDTESSDSIVIGAVVKSSMGMDGNEFRTQQPNMGLMPDIKRFLTFRGG